MSENVTIQAHVLMAGRTGWGDLDPEIVRETIREDVAIVVKQVLGDKETMKVFWGSAIEAFQERATVSTGKFAIGAVGAVLKRGALWAIVGLTIYYFGGIGALVAFVKSQVGGH